MDERTILYSGYGSTIVDLGNGKVIKYGPRVRKLEAINIAFISRETNIPVPKIYDVYTEEGITHIVMEKIEGKNLEEEMKNVNITEIVDQIEGYITQMKRISSGINKISPANHLFTHYVDVQQSEVDTVEDFIKLWMSRSKETEESIYQVFNNIISFAHGDLTPPNIMIRDGKIVSIIDWEYSGWYPYFWDPYMIVRYIEKEWGRMILPRYKNLEKEISTFSMLEYNADLLG